MGQTERMGQMNFEQENEFLREKIKTIVQKLSDYEQTVGMLGIGALSNVRQIIESELGLTYEELLSGKSGKKVNGGLENEQ